MITFRSISPASRIARTMCLTSLLLVPAAAALGATDEDRTGTRVAAEELPLIPNTSLPIPSTTFPSSTIPLPTTSTTVPVTECGDASGDGSITALDALVVLKAAIGAYEGCTIETCDADGNDTVSASDSLRVLQKAVGYDVDMRCTTS